VTRASTPRPLTRGTSASTSRSGFCRSAPRLFVDETMPYIQPAARGVPLGGVHRDQCHHGIASAQATPAGPRELPGPAAETPQQRAVRSGRDVFRYRSRLARMMESIRDGSAEHQLRWRPILLSLELKVAGKADLAELTLGVAVSIARGQQLRMRRPGRGADRRGHPIIPARVAGHVAGRLPRQCVRGGEPAAQLVVKVGGCGDADAVGE